MTLQYYCFTLLFAYRAFFILTKRLFLFLSLFYKASTFRSRLKTLMIKNCNEEEEVDKEEVDKLTTLVLVHVK
jgi:hypothetical protein